jgi:hypothetical protein
VTELIRIIRPITQRRECHAGFAVDNLEKFPAATGASSTLTFTVVDDEILAREHVYRSYGRVIMGGVEAARVKAEESLKRIVVRPGVIWPVTEVNSAEEHQVSLSGKRERG